MGGKWLIGQTHDIGGGRHCVRQVEDENSDERLRFVTLSDNVAAYSAIGSYGIIGLCTLRASERAWQNQMIGIALTRTCR